MSFEYFLKIFNLTRKSFPFLMLLLIIRAKLLNSNLIANGTELETIETIKFKDARGIDHIEYAFRAPMKGYPEEVVKMYCANIKLRLYWNVYREEIKSTRRTAQHLRRLARFARHMFKEVRLVDKPFNAEMLSTIDEWFGVNLDEEDEKELEKATQNSTLSISLSEKKSKPINSMKSTVRKVKSLVTKYMPTIVVGIYTRWQTMWWLMMSCLFAKYYLWDPALDEFVKLQKSLIMYPDFQLVKLTDINCLPITFFQRLLDTCKILNPLMNIDFGQLSLDKMWKFKGDLGN